MLYSLADFVGKRKNIQTKIKAIELVLPLDLLLEKHFGKHHL